MNKDLSFFWKALNQLIQENRKKLFFVATIFLQNVEKCCLEKKILGLSHIHKRKILFRNLSVLFFLPLYMTKK